METMEITIITTIEIMDTMIRKGSIIIIIILTTTPKATVLIRPMHWNSVQVEKIVFQIITIKLIPRMLIKVEIITPMQIIKAIQIKII